MDRWISIVGFLIFAPSYPFSTLFHPALCPERITFGFQLDLANGSTRSQSEERKGGKSGQGSVLSFFLWDHGRFQNTAEGHCCCQMALSIWPSLPVDSENYALPSPFQFSQRTASFRVIALNSAHAFVNHPFIKLSYSYYYI